MPYVEVCEHIEGVTAEQVYKVICDMEKFPSFMPDIAEVRVLAREDNTTITAWHSHVNGMDFRWVERDYFDDVNLTIEYEQIEGDLKQFLGKWQVKATPENVKIILGVTFELGVPLLADMINPILSKTISDNCAKMIIGIKKEFIGVLD